VRRVAELNEGMIIPPRLIAALTGALLFSPWLFGAKADPLSRQTPVPASEPVPLSDFIRPLLFVTPSMNEAGTHVAALAPVDAERIGASVAELGTGKSKPLQGRETYDVLSIQWLDDQWLMYDMIRENLYLTDGTLVMSPAGIRWCKRAASAASQVFRPRTGGAR
jgi:hypothetical protein